MYSGIKHIFFDLDDTLWDFEKNSEAVLVDLFEEYDLANKLQTDFYTFHSTYKVVNNDLWSAYYKKSVDKQFLRDNRFHITFQKFSYNNYEENLLVTEQYLVRSPYGTHLKTGCIQTLDYLKNKYSLHIITNGFKEVQNIKLDNTGLRKYFDHIIISEEHSLTKPDEKIFRLAEQFSGSIREECVMIGDNVESDIEGALNAGWKAIWLTNTPNEVKINQIGELSELSGIF